MFRWFKKNKNIDDPISPEYAELQFMEKLYIEENLMPLKETFLRYVEMQRCANSTKDQYGIESKNTKEAYEQANAYKRKVLDMIEELEKK